MQNEVVHEKESVRSRKQCVQQRTKVQEVLKMRAGQHIYKTLAPMKAREWKCLGRVRALPRKKELTKILKTHVYYEKPCTDQISKDLAELNFS